MVQMPGGIPVGTLRSAKPGAVNAALFAAAILALADPAIHAALTAYLAAQRRRCWSTPTPGRKLGSSIGA